MKYLIGIGYVNRQDLLTIAINSIKPYWPNTVIIDNSPNQDLRINRTLPIPVYEPPVPLSFSQTMNLLQVMAREKNCDVVMFLHNDAEAHPGTPEAFLSMLESLKKQKRRWGVAFTNYHSLVAFNMEAIRNVGLWDTTMPRYFADVDYYHKVQLAGFENINTLLGVTHHYNGSCTIKSDPNLMFIHNITFPLYQQYYEKKWGGPPGQERFTKPFNI